MKKLSSIIVSALVFSILAITFNLTSCKKEENPLKFPKGTFPDSAIFLTDLNSVYNDYETTNIFSTIDDIDTYSHVLIGNIVSVFSSDRTYTGEQYDLVQGILTFEWDQKTGLFGLGADITQNTFLTKLTTAANTSADDRGPFRIFSSVDGYEYLIYSSRNTSGDLDFYYLKNQPVLSSTLPAVQGPFPVQLLNTGADDIYISFDTNQDSAYFSSDNGGDNFDIYLKSKPADTDLTTWFNSGFAASNRVDSINSTRDDNCPMVFRKIMVFASNRLGGIGGFDLYYSKFKNGKWSSPINFGPYVNTEYDEYRPVIGTHNSFTNHFLIFSSNRPGGKGLYDLYFRGVTIN
ncbi:MAG: hypothetical protein MUC93_03590 [Bacteroidales bacterium]|jgi:hypothetical protein|nr:hypothetical protein [Bacteroidales bacterium]